MNSALKIKTIFIAAFHTLASRNILATDVLKSLSADPELRLVIFVPLFKTDFLKEQYGRDNIIFVGFNERQLNNYFWFENLTSLAFSFLSTYTAKLRSQEKLRKEKSLRALVKYGRNRFAGAFLSRLMPARFLLRFFDRFFSPIKLLNQYFDQYQPLAVFATDVFLAADVLFLQAAKARRILSIGMVRSWDNTTTKGLMRCLPDKLIVNNEIIKKEAVELHDFSAKNIFVSGLPQFDIGFLGKRTPRQEFFGKIGLNPKKRMILFAPAGQFLSDTDWQICEILKNGLDQKKIPSDLQFLVRSHPMDPAPLSQFQPDERFVIERPGTYFKVETRNLGVVSGRRVVAGDPVDLGQLNAKLTEMSLDDLNHLFDSLYHSEMLIQVNSTIGIDSLIFDKPDIMIEFDGWEKKNYLDSVERYHHEDHMQKFLKTGAIRIVRSQEELFEWINKYLEGPELDSGKRKIGAGQQIKFLDGQSGKRAAEFILKSIND